MIFIEDPFASDLVCFWPTTVNARGACANERARRGRKQQGRDEPRASEHNREILVQILEMICNVQMLRAPRLVLTFTALSMSVSAAVILGESAWAGGRQEMSPRVQEVRKESEVESEVEFMRRQKVGRKSGEGATGGWEGKDGGKDPDLAEFEGHVTVGLFQACNLVQAGLHCVLSTRRTGPQVILLPLSPSQLNDGARGMGTGMPTHTYCECACTRIQLMRHRRM